MSDETTGSNRLGCLLKGCAVVVLIGAAGLAATGVALNQAFSWGIYEGVPPSKTPLVIRGGTLIDGTAAPPTQGIVLVIEDGRIACASRKCGIPANADVIDAAGTTVIPGLIDAHVHLFTRGTVGEHPAGVAGQWDTLRWRPGVRRGLLEAGVTTVRSVGDDPRLIHDLAAKQASGELRGPRILAAGPMLTAPGGYPADQLPNTAVGITDDATARAAVTETVGNGAALVALAYDDGGGGRYPKITENVLQAVVSEAHAQDVPLAVHPGTAADMRNAAFAGVDTLENLPRGGVDDATLNLLAGRDGLVVVPTLAWVEAGRPAELAQAKEAVTAMVGKVAIGVGSDTQGPGMTFGASTAREVELLTESGLSPVDALRAATAGNAKVLRRTDLGTLVEGQVADLVLVRGKPHERIGDLRQVAVVIQEGRIVVDSR